MIKTFRHKGLKAFFEHGDVSRIRPEHSQKLSKILAILDEIDDIKEMNFSGSGLHALIGDKLTFWSVKVSANWRVIFRFESGDAFDVDYVDYH